MRVRWLALMALLAAPAGAQVTTAPARPDSTDAPPRFPDMLRAAHIGGTVRVRLVVDTAGRTLPETFRVLHSDHDVFLASVRNALARWRFMPARRDGRAVPDTIEQDVTFEFPRESAVTVADPAVLAWTAVAPRHYRLVIGWPDADPARPPLDSAATSRIALAAMDLLVETLVPTDTVSLTRIVCVGAADSVRWGQPDALALQRLARARLAVLVSPRCPPTFAGPIAHIGSDGRVVGSPPGEDPWMVEILSVRSYAMGIAVIRAAIRHGTSSSYYRCRADRDAAELAKWVAACEPSGMSISSIEVMHPRDLAEIPSR